MTQSAQPDHRHYTRIQFDAQVRLSHGATHWSSTLIDISLKGALFSQPQDWPGKPGDGLLAELVLDNDVVIRMQGTVAHVEAGHIGLRCDHIDLDSIAHLKRLVELNLGDEEQLNRELSSLG
ncbi:MAG: PilZ domain-containing protein [Gammaproteobacteria bacterium]|nr:PilZ domain-containing protein [Gammaproteobacteria bacterium]